MAECFACHAENSEGARFCSSCGAALGDQRPSPTRARKTVTVVFTDVVGSTSIGEQMDPETVRAVMARYFDAMRTCLERHGGTVEKFIGDAVMAVFGVPTVHEDDAMRAVRATVDMRGALEELNSDLEREWGVRVQNRTGVNTGEVVVGEVGAGSTLATGDAVNVAGRLEQAASAGEVLVGELTHRLTRQAGTFESVEPVAAKGKAKPLRAFRLLDVDSEQAGRPGGARLVGRDAELRALREAFESLSSDPRPRLLTVVGAPGVGKSRLARETLGELGGKARTLRGRCLPYGEGITFWPIAEAFRQAAEVRDHDSPDAARSKIVALAARHPEADRVGDIAALTAGVGTGTAPAAEIAWGIREMLMNIAGSGPTILLLDDIQWAEEPFLDLIAGLGAERREARLLVLCLARPELDEVRPGWRDVSTVLPLEALDESDAEELVETLMGSWGIPPDARARIASAAGGNPLFVEELVAMLVEEGLLRRDESGAWRARDLARMEMPPSLGALLSARLDRLSEAERRVAECASVIGEEFSGLAVEALTEKETDFEEAVAGLLRREVIQGSNGAMRFRHILIRDAAYARLPKQLRADLHEGFASWLEKDAGQRVAEVEEILGYHLEQAHHYFRDLRPPTASDLELGARAAGHLHSAGSRALGRGDIEATVHLIDRALTVVPREHPHRLEMQVELGDALTSRGELKRAAELLARTIEEAHAARDLGLATRADLMLSELQLELDPEPTQVLEAKARTAIELFERTGDDSGLTRAWALLGQSAWEQSLYAASGEAMERALEHASRAGDTAQQVRAREWIAYGILWGPTPTSEGIALMNEGLRDPPSRTLEAALNWTRGGLLAMQGHFDEARSSLSIYARITEELGYNLRGAASQVEGIVEMLAGDPAAAERRYMQNIRALEAMNDIGYLPTTLGYLGHAFYAQGRYDEAEATAIRARDMAAPDDLMSQFLWRAVQAKVKARRGEINEALDLVEEAVRLSGQSDGTSDHADAEMDRAEVLELAGRIDEARGCVERAIGLYEKKENLVSAARARDRLRGLSEEVDRP